VLGECTLHRQHANQRALARPLGSP